MAPSRSAAERLAETPHADHTMGEWRVENGASFYRCTCGVELTFPATIRPPTPTED